MDLMKVLFIITLNFCFYTVIGQNETPFIVRGNELYKQQQYDKAAEEYKKATEQNSKSAEAQYNLGNALSKMKKQEEAVKAFESATDKTNDKSFKSKAGYNKGVMYSKEKKLTESIEAYKFALRLNPDDNEARENLQKALNELKKQQPPKQDKQNKNQQNQKKDNKPQKNKSNLNPKQAEQMLNALRQEEKKLQQSFTAIFVITGPKQ